MLADMKKRLGISSSVTLKQIVDARCAATSLSLASLS